MRSPRRNARLQAHPVTRPGIAYDAASLDAGDLLVNGEPASGVTPVDDDTVAFTLPSLGKGVYTVSLAAGSIEPQVAGPAVLAYSSSFEIDLTLPVITVDSLSTTDTTPAMTGTVDDPEATVLATVDGTTYTAKSCVHSSGSPQPARCRKETCSR